MTARRSGVVLVTVGATLAYFVAVTQRSTLGVAGVAATERFQVAAGALAALGVAQLIVYAVLQIPVGVLVDRYGPKIVLVVGALLMVVGQVQVAFAPTLVPAVVGRMLVGAGDAGTFVPVLRLLAAWYPARQVPVVSQWVGNVGQLGQVLSAVPFALLVHLTGWQTSFLTAAGLGGVSVVVAVLLVRDPPRAAPTPGALRATLRALAASVRRPGTRLGFWTHFVTQSSGVVFALFWGYPFLQVACGYSPAEAAGFLSIPVFAGFVAGPVLGSLIGRHPLRRSNLVFLVVGAMGVAWLAVLLWPGGPPAPVLVLLMIAIGVGGPASQIGFDYARTTNPPEALGGANGFVNVGGFTASFTMMLLIGVLLDVQHALGVAPDPSGGEYSLPAFRVAFAVQYVVVGFGTAMLIRQRRIARTELADAGTPVTPLRVALLERLARRGGT